jgi:YtkA-like
VTVRRRVAGLVVVLVGTLGVASCSGSESAGPGGGAGAFSAAQSASAGPVNVTFGSEPDPPKAGDNGFLVTVKQPDGTPVTDASVTAVFSMPAMPSMNMPAMRSDAALAHEGAGIYRGTGQLSMSGTWNVTVSVARNGQDVGSARFSVVAK